MLAQFLAGLQWSVDFNRLGNEGWDVLALSSTHEDSSKESIHDIFARDHATGRLGFVAYGANFSRVRSASLSKVLARVNMTSTSSNTPVAQQSARPDSAPSTTVQACLQPVSTKAKWAEPKASSAPRVTSLPPAAWEVIEPVKPSTKSTATAIASQAFETKLRSVLARITDIPEDQFRADANLMDLGIDSLMGTEIASEVEAVFHVSIPPDALLNILTFVSLRDYISTHSNGALPTSEVPSHQVQMANPKQNPVEAPRGESMPTVPTTWGGNPKAAGDLQEIYEKFKSPAPVHGLNSSHLIPKPDSTGHREEHQHQELVSRLASLLSDHLECPVTALERSTNLFNLGLDSLLCMEVMSDIQTIFGFSVDLAKLTTDSTFGELSDILVTVAGTASSSTVTTTGTPERSPSISSTSTTENGLRPYQENSIRSSSSPWSALSTAPQQFEVIKADLDGLVDEYGFTGFYRSAANPQDQLVLAYTIEAMADLGVQLDQLRTGETIPYPSNVLPKHHRLRDALFEILRHGGIADYDGRQFVRSDKPITCIPAVHSSALLRNLTAQFPQHANEHRLLAVTGSELADLMRGTKDPLRLLYGSKENRTLLEDVYGSSPMYIIMSRLLTTFLDKALSDSSPPPDPDGVFRILELGAGTGSTTRWVIDRLEQRGIPFEYTFSDISTALTSAARRKFASHPASSRMRYATIDIEAEPPLELCGQYDVVLSTNCIHATRNLGASLKNIASLLKPHGFVSLVEFTTRFYWFDLVFGLLDGWWLFDDGRPYVLAPPEFWSQAMRGAGFGHVSWTGGSTRESEAVRIISGFKRPVENPELCQSVVQERTGAVETLVFGYTDEKLPLRADAYHPSPSQAAAHKTWTVGLMIHGGGHVMLSRKDIRPRQTQLLLDNGVVPISIDYRLCPETTLLTGPMPDVLTAYVWARTILPTLKLSSFQSTATTLDPLQRVVVIGWSTGGTLAMSLAWTAASRGLAPPEAVLAFYCPTDYEDAFWTRPNIPIHTETAHQTYADAEDGGYNVVDGVLAAPITGYNVPAGTVATGGWMAPEDARSRIVLHMNWRGQALPILLKGLPAAKDAGKSKNFNHLEWPPAEDVAAVSPHAQIIRGRYASPTWLVFGTSDDLIPWRQAERTVDALRTAGLEAGLTLVPAAPHLFDLYRDRDGRNWKAVLEGYSFLLARIGKILRS